MRVTLAILLCLLAVGCRSDARCLRETALLRAEILDLEDKYYLLKSNHEAAVGELRGLRGQSSELGETYYQDDYSEVMPGEVIYDGMIYESDPYETAPYETELYQTTPSGQPMTDGQIIYDHAPYLNGPAGATPAYELGEPLPTTEPGPVAPSDAYELPTPISQGEEGDSQTQIRSRNNREDFSLDELEIKLPAAQARTSRPAAFARPEAKSAGVTKIKINELVSRGRNVDGREGDEGVDLLIQPLDSNGAVRLQTGELTVSVIDPAAEPDRQRIGLWKFLPAETELFFANDELDGRGILLHLPWEQAVPLNSELVVHVRFVSLDGRTLKSSSPLIVTPPSSGYSPNDPLVRQWSQRDPRWIPELDLDTATSGESQADRRWRANQSRPLRNISAQAGEKRFTTPTARSRTSQQSGAKPVEKPGWRPTR